MDFKIIIPARYCSTRLSKKLMRLIGSKTVLQHVWEKAIQTDAKEILIATDAQEIYDHCVDFGAKVMMTDSSHSCATDRLAEVCVLEKYDANDIIVNLQGDEPLISKEYIYKTVEMLQHAEFTAVGTLAYPIKDNEQINDPNVVKVVLQNNNNALYFSRAPIPYNAKKTYGHIGLYAYRVGAILAFSQYKKGNLEESESLEQLRFLENGQNIVVSVVADKAPIGVNTEQELEKVRKIMLEQDVL